MRQSSVETQDPVRRAAPTADIEMLRARLKEAEDTLRAIRLGEADALVVEGSDGPRVYTLVTADQSYRTLVEQMREAALILTDQGTIVYCNSRLNTLVGSSGISLAGRTLGELAVEEDRAALLDLLGRGSLGEAEGEIRLRCSYGEPVPVHLSVGELRTGGFNGLAAIATDLTEQRRREKAAERERLTEAVLEFAGVAILVCDMAGRVVRANRAALQLCGEASVGQRFEAVVPIGVAYDELRGAPEGPRQVTLRPPGGEERYLLVGARRIGRGGPEDGWWVVTLADQTERERLYAAERAGRAAAEGANQAKSKFLAVVSHELRTPLNSVIGYADLLLAETHGPLGGEQKVFAERIQTSARHQLSLIEEILAYARIDAGHEELHLAPVAVPNVIRDVAEFLRPEAERKGLALRLVLQPGRELEVVTDPGKLRQILLNLVGNALKFTREGSVAIEAGWEEDGWLALRVRDTGPGIASDQLEAIWEPFTQVDTAPARGPAGTGLGLAIVRGMVELMRGQTAVDTEVDGGTTFTVRLPEQVQV